ncbi:hypothetical protein A4X13_0g3241 [Tilletia indica]|uniref:Uncharacterized protein n=1 Tax=Tilletia indica TaxID=43049 RepID=A0A177TKN0_9BASI|nr:hypothetical protein A4X13_0g3241 [Tilletia indica]
MDQQPPFSSPYPTPSQEELNQLEDQLSHQLQHSTWKPIIHPWERTLASSQAAFRVHCIRQEVNDLHAQCDQARNRLERRKAEFAARRERLISARELEASERRRAEDLEKANTVLSKRLTAVGLSLHRRRVHLLRLLEQIYPIELDDPSQFLFSIASVPLPNGTSSTDLRQQQRSASKGKEKASEPAEVTLKNQDAEVTAAALGLVAQLVTLLSAYLETPIHYPLATAGSRSVVQDAISIMNGPRAFPLYSKGVEGYRFEYAVFLLNKDIEQLVNEHHVPLIDLRQTLPNLKNLMITVISATSPKAYTSSASRRHISARQIALSSTSSPPTSILQLHPHHHHPSGPSSSSYIHHHHLGKGHPFSSSSSTASSGSAALPGAMATAAGNGGRLHSNASVSISVASANGSDITLAGGVGPHHHNHHVRPPSNGSSTGTGGGGAGVMRAGGGPGGGGGANARSASQASVASTWAASLLGWKTFYANGSASGSELSLGGSGSGPNSPNPNGGGGTGTEEEERRRSSLGSVLGLGLSESESKSSLNSDGTVGAGADAEEGRTGKNGQAGPPTVRRLGAAKS